MLLFFDDIAVFSPPEHRSRPPAVDPRLCAPLAERGLLKLVNPRVVLTSQNEAIIWATLHRAAMENAEHWLGAATAGDWDIDVPRLQGRFSGPEPGGPGPSGTRDRRSLELFKLLAQDGLLLPDDSTDEEWVPGIASVANSILAQAVCATARGQGWLLEPIATRRDEAKVITAILEDAVENVSASDVVASDLSAVALDLSHVGLDDIVDFRARHRTELRAHVLALQALLASGLTSGDVADRRAALADGAHRLRQLQLRRWTKLGAGVSLGIVGAGWTLASGDLLGALIAGAAVGSLRFLDGPTRVSAYTYLLRPDSGLAG